MIFYIANEEMMGIASPKVGHWTQLDIMLEVLGLEEMVGDGE